LGRTLYLTPHCVAIAAKTAMITMLSPHPARRLLAASVTEDALAVLLQAKSAAQAEQAAFENDIIPS
jgi:hypothetical protein